MGKKAIPYTSATSGVNAQKEIRKTLLRLGCTAIAIGEDPRCLKAPVTELILDSTANRKCCARSEHYRIWTQLRHWLQDFDATQRVQYSDFYCSGLSHRLGDDTP
jgi:hypothetical protein